MEDRVRGDALFMFSPSISNTTKKCYETFRIIYENVGEEESKYLSDKNLLKLNTRAIS